MKYFKKFNIYEEDIIQEEKAKTISIEAELEQFEHGHK